VSRQAQRDRALSIAARDGLVATPGTNGWWIVERPNQQRRGHAPYHVVKVLAGRLVCDCPAGQYGTICCHRAAVHQALVAQREGDREHA
jgi:hypothetical protein